MDSIRGRTGGYRVAADVCAITLWDIFRAVEDGIYPVECVDEHEDCRYSSSCVTNGPWQLIFSNVEGATGVNDSVRTRTAVRGGRKDVSYGRHSRVQAGTGTIETLRET